ncbi:YjjG family noncanonical pyrimidine nucleotidase [Jiulongibacter sp. NS-SX5]|uniref:YjjG family noncanonical pyrimidine nucleotidase n=1 Tax=Jiulongibacter sp. NS-SX5 TaxID=3463854 RepID=UPI004059F6BA
MFTSKRHLFFDLDHTLWDFEKNAEECLHEIFDTNNFQNFGINFQQFFPKFSEINRSLWTQLERNEITHEKIRKERFQLCLNEMGAHVSIDDSEKYNQLFLDLLPNKTSLIKDCIPVLDELKSKYVLHILSNGYFEIQLRKLSNSKIEHYFKEVITNDIAAARKPDVRIFEFALAKAKSSKNESLMIGDSHEADIKGAEMAGIQAIHFDQYDRDETSRHSPKIKELSQLLDYL